MDNNEIYDPDYNYCDWCSAWTARDYLVRVKEELVCEKCWEKFSEEEKCLEK